MGFEIVPFNQNDLIIRTLPSPGYLGLGTAAAQDTTGQALRKRHRANGTHKNSTNIFERMTIQLT
jgi:hypothetical protein